MAQPIPEHEIVRDRWRLVFHRRRNQDEVSLPYFGFRLLEVIDDTESEIRRYYQHYTTSDLTIAAEIHHNGEVVERYSKEEPVPICPHCDQPIDESGCP